MRRPIIALLVVFLGVSCERKPAGDDLKAVQPPDPTRRVVARVDKFTLAISPKAAPDGTFPLTVSLDRAAGPVTLPIAARVSEIQEMTGESTAGDPLDRVDFKAMVSGEEESKVSTWIRPLRTPEGRVCVLAEQEFGFEHTKRNHTIVCAEDGKQRAAWSREEGAGPTWTSVDIKDLDNDKIDEVIYFDGYALPEDADKLDVTVWKWSGAELKESPGAVKTVIAAKFKTPQLARKARAAAKADACKNQLWVLESGRGEFALGIKTTLDVKSMAIWKAWQGCFPGVKVLE